MRPRHPELLTAIQHIITRRINRVRDRHGRERLTTADGLAEVAAAYAKTMGYHGTLGHDVGGTTPAERADGYHAVSENVARVGRQGVDAHAIARRAVQGWLDSARHRENLLRSDAHRTGVGVYAVGDEVYCCQLFAE